MTDSTPPLPAPVPAPEAPQPPKPSVARRIITVVIVVVVAAGAWFATQAILNAVAPKTPTETSEEPTETSEPETEAPAESGAFLYENSEYGFSVELPGEPVESTQTQAVVGFDITMLQVQWTAAENVVLVQASVFPPEILAQDTETLLVNSIAGAAGASGATVTEESATDLDGAPARAATLTFTNGQEARLIIALKDSTQITIMSIGDVSFDDIAASFAFTG